MHEGIVHTNQAYPFMRTEPTGSHSPTLSLPSPSSAHSSIPSATKWVLQFGIIACTGVIPLALIAGPIRSIPPYWRLIDCSFGVIGVFPLLICLRHVRSLEARAIDY